LGGSGSSRGSDGPSWRKDHQSTQNGAKSAKGEKEVLSLKANGEECETEMNGKERSTGAEDSGGFNEGGERLVDKVLGEGEGSLEERQKEGKVEADGVKEDACVGVLSHTAEKYIRERLDRAIASHAWRMRFPAYKVVNGDHRHSDHRPVIVDTHGGERVRQSPARGFTRRFEARWLEEEACKGIVENGWLREVEGNKRGVWRR
jgi:hypothetical protein